jgi:uncharacterized protein YfaS (alpha-2-macroglobulin family)
MKTAGKALALIAVAALCMGAFSAVAVAGKKKKKTAVVYFTDNPRFNKGGKVMAKGTLNTVSACKPSRGMRLQLLDANGAVIGTLDGSTSDSSGNWVLSGQLPNALPAGTNSVRVKATKRSVKKFVCKAGVSVPVAIPAA